MRIESNRIDLAKSRCFSASRTEGEYYQVDSDGMRRSRLTEIVSPSLHHLDKDILRVERQVRAVMDHPAKFEAMLEREKRVKQFV